MNIVILITVLIGWSNKVLKLKDKPLLEEAKEGRVEAIRALIVCGVNVNHADQYGSTALMVDAVRGRLLSFMKAYSKIKFDL